MAVANYLESLDSTAYQRYLEKLGSIRLDKCPYDILETEWVDDVTCWPPVTYPDVYTYLIDTPGQFTRESLKAYKSLEAYNYALNGWVQALLVLRKGSSTTRDSDIIMLRGKVSRSQRLNEQPHCIWMAVKKDGSVVTAHCTCMAGYVDFCVAIISVSYFHNMFDATALWKSYFNFKC